MSTPSQKVSLKAARLVLIGAISGDIIGSSYEFNHTKSHNFELLTKYSKFTDDTVCSIGVADALISGAPFAERIRQWCLKYPRAGYGSRFFLWFNSPNPMPYNSWGNGSAMRVSAVGAYAESLEQALSLAADSAGVSHNHPEGIKGAQATAAAIYLALTGHDKTAIKEYIESKFGYDLSRDYAKVQPGYSFDVSCQGSVPESIISFLHSSDYESAIRNAVAMGGDADTMGAITGGIAAAYYGFIPRNILDIYAQLVPADMVRVVDDFNRMLGKRHSPSQYCYRYPHPAVTTDCVVFAYDGDELNVLLVKRGSDPYKGFMALPGGFLNPDETALQGATRELEEETGLIVTNLEQLHTYTAPDRDPRERVISIAYMAVTEFSEVKGGDDAAEAGWYPVSRVPDLAFDHFSILRDAVSRLRGGRT